MKVSYSGWNLLGVVPECNSPLITSFLDVTYEARDLYLTHTNAFLINDRGLFVHGHIKDRTHQTQKIEGDHLKSIKRVTGFCDNVDVLCDNGELYKANLINVRLDKCTNSIENKKEFVADIARGLAIDVTVTKNGAVFNENRRLDFKNDVSQVVVGNEHCILLDRYGNVYTFGAGRRGQLGHGNLADETNPKQIDALAGIRIKKIAAGSFHSCALSADGDLYVWGSNSDHQLTDQEESTSSITAIPRVVNFPDFEEIVADVACGTKHTVALAGKKLYGTGWNEYNQLEDSEAKHVAQMKHIFNVKNEVVRLVCGPWSTAVLTIE